MSQKGRSWKFWLLANTVAQWEMLLLPKDMIRCLVTCCQPSLQAPITGWYVHSWLSCFWPDYSSPSMYSIMCEWKPLLCRNTGEAGCRRVCAPNMGNPGWEDVRWEPGGSNKHLIARDAETSIYTAVAVWTWGDEKNRSLVTGTASIEADKRSRRAWTASMENATVKRPLENQE